MNLFASKPIDLWASLNNGSWIHKPRSDSDEYFVAVVQVFKHTVQAGFPFTSVAGFDNYICNVGGYAVLKDVGLAPIDELVINNTCHNEKHAHEPVFIFKTSSRSELLLQLFKVLDKYPTVGSVEYRTITPVEADDGRDTELCMEEVDFLPAISEIKRLNLGELVYYEGHEVVHGQIIRQSANVSR